MTYDIALTEGRFGVIAHVADCPQARMEAAMGYPVATLIGCKRLPELPFHSCLTAYTTTDASRDRGRSSDTPP